MVMATRYVQVLDVRVRHEFSRTGVSSDFALIPLASTLWTIQRRRWLLRTEATGIRMFCPATDEPSPRSHMPLDGPIELYFNVEPRHPRAAVVTDLPAIRTGSAYLFTPPPPIAEPIPSYITPVRSTLRLPVETSEASLLFRLVDANGDLLDEHVELARDDVATYQFDVRDLAEGVYRVKYTSEGTAETRAYLKFSRSEPPRFGFLYLRYDGPDAFSTTSIRRFDITFSSSHEMWRYFLKNTSPAKKYRIVSPDPALTFTSNADSSTSLVFVSNDPIPYQEIPRALALVELDANDSPKSPALVPALPNPTGAQPSANMYVYLKS